MKRAIFGTFATLLLTAAIAPGAIAGKVALNAEAANRTSLNVQAIEPVDLVNRAYNGAYIEQGVPSYAALTNARRYHTITAEDLVKAGINEGRLTVAALDDRAYVSAVENALEDLSRDGLSN